MFSFEMSVYAKLPASLSLCDINITISVGTFREYSIVKWPAFRELSRYQIMSIMKSKIAIDSYHCPIFLVKL